MKEVRRESIFKCLVDLSIIAGTISIVFIVSMALILSSVNYVMSVGIAITVGVIYFVYRVITETGNGGGGFA